MSVLRQCCNDFLHRNHSLYIYDNQNLRELWSKEQQVSIMQGKAFFHLNPLLCMNIIRNISDITPGVEDDNIDLSTNGEKAACKTPYHDRIVSLGCNNGIFQAKYSLEAGITISVTKE